MYRIGTFLFLVLFCFLSLKGCSKEKDVPTIDTQKGPYGGSIVISSISDPRSFNEIIAKETSTTQAVGFLFEGLTETDGVTTEVKPCLSKSWTTSQDGCEWVFRLREDVKWFDGAPFTADDVVFTFNSLIYNDQIPASARDIFTIFGKKMKVIKLDRFRVKFILPKPFAPLLRQLAQPILPKHVLESAVREGRFNSVWGVDTSPDEIIGTGPFKLKEYRPGEHLVYIRNPLYWKKDAWNRPLPYLDKIIMLIVPHQDAQLVSFKNGDLDILSIREKDYAFLKRGQRAGNYTVYNCGPAFGTNFLVFNQNPNYVDKVKLSWFRDLAFRRAVAHSIDKKTIIDNVTYGLGYPQDSAMSRAAVVFYNPKVKRYEYDKKKALEILAQGGYKDRDNDGFLEDKHGNKIKFTLITNTGNDTRQDIGVIITGDLRDIGMDVTFTPIDFNNLVSRLDSTYDWDAVLIGLTGGIEPHFGKNVWATDGHLHFWNPRPRPRKNQEALYEKEVQVWKKHLPVWEREVDEIFNKAGCELDTERRRRLYFRWQELVAENLPVIYTISGPVLYAVRNRFGNIKPTSYGGVLHNIEEIFVRRPQATP